MRDFQFRAWDDELKKIVKWGGMGVAMHGGVVIEHELGVITTYPPGMRYLLMQFTGLKDKNEKEIYEGDIVKVCRSYGYGFLPKGSIAVVTWDENELCYFLNGKFRLTSKKCVEVIGNIYENPELIK